jgi:hypothetical protein
MNPYILTDESLTVVIEGKAHTMNHDHPAWQQANQALKDEDWERLESLFDVGKAVEDYFDSESEVEIKDGAVLYQGEYVHNLVVDKVLSFMRGGLPYKPLIKFLGKLMENPSARSVNELYRFLEHKNMPLTSEGNFLAYKGVKENFTDFYSGKFDNSVGKTLNMRRNGVCDDANMGCSSGFHAGSYDYAKGYASNGGHLMVVEIDPRDVVSVPHDCDCQKLRTSKYVVVGVYETIEAPALEDGQMPSYVEWDEDFDGVDEDTVDYGAGWNAGYDQAKKDMEE